MHQVMPVCLNKIYMIMKLDLRKFQLYLRVLILLALSGCILCWYIWHPQMASLREWVASLKYHWSSAGLLFGGLVYAILLSLPFVPGAELGLMVMMFFGKEGVLFIYFCTVAGLNLAYLTGYLLNGRNLTMSLNTQFFNKQGGEWMDDILHRSLFGRTLLQHIGPRIMKHRYLILAILFNLPGNVVFGGGGGIAMLSGMSQMVNWQRYFMTVLLATSPVPILVFFGILNLNLLLNCG
jgi:hypothetical protein